MAYRADLWVGIVGVFVLNGATLGTTWVLLQRFDHLGGWGFYEIVFLYNLWLLGHGLRVILFRHVGQLESYIIEGTFDQFLIRPLSPLLQYLSREVHYLGLGDVLVSGTGIALAYHHLGMHWSAGTWLWFFVVVLSACVVELSLILLLASTAFWTGRSTPLVNTATQFSFGVVQQYPIHIFGRPLQAVVTVLLPFAFMNYYPSLYFLGKAQGYGVLPYVSPGVAAVLLVLAGWVWHKGLEQYKSTGS
ncbi:MAG: ABC-2 family transporter protein [Alicyclobacillaceae bacterium]|nr:ABC-2 family transporter protein [Alicyclobacillaceae bacterium]